jgi:hypothetical protein
LRKKQRQTLFISEETRQGQLESENEGKKQPSPIHRVLQAFHECNYIFTGVDCGLYNKKSRKNKNHLPARYAGRYQKKKYFFLPAQLF